jgi:hypothetical protein
MYQINKKFIVAALAAFSVVSSAYADSSYHETALGLDTHKSCYNRSYRTDSHPLCKFDFIIKNYVNKPFLVLGYINITVDARHLGKTAIPTPYKVFINLNLNDKYGFNLYSLVYPIDKINVEGKNYFTCLTDTCLLTLDATKYAFSGIPYHVEVGIDFGNDIKRKLAKTSDFSVHVDYGIHE